MSEDTASEEKEHEITGRTTETDLQNAMDQLHGRCGRNDTLRGKTYLLLKLEGNPSSSNFRQGDSNYTCFELLLKRKHESGVEHFLKIRMLVHRNCSLQEINNMSWQPCHTPTNLPCNLALSATEHLAQTKK